MGLRRSMGANGQAKKRRGSLSAGALKTPEPSHSEWILDESRQIPTTKVVSTMRYKLHTAQVAVNINVIRALISTLNGCQITEEVFNFGHKFALHRL